MKRKYFRFHGFTQHIPYVTPFQFDTKSLSLWFTVCHRISVSESHSITVLHIFRTGDLKIRPFKTKTIRINLYLPCILADGKNCSYWNSLSESGLILLFNSTITLNCRYIHPNESEIYGVVHFFPPFWLRKKKKSYIGCKRHTFGNSRELNIARRF